MINFLKNWCEGILIAVIISILIEALLPEGNNKKYVKVVIGIYIIFTIFNPFFNKQNIELEFSNLLPNQTIETAGIDTDNIKKLYANGIETTMKNNLEENLGYKIASLSIDFDINYENIEKITIKIQKEGIEKIEEVNIYKEQANNNDNYEDIRNYILQNYEVLSENIIIN